MAGYGQIPHEPTEVTRALVSNLASVGITHKMIAEKLDIVIETLYKYYDRELKENKVDMVHSLAKKVFRRALEEDDFKAQTYLLDRHSGWSTPKAEATVEKSMTEEFAHNAGE